MGAEKTLPGCAPSSLELYVSQYREYADTERQRWAAFAALGVQSFADAWENAVSLYADHYVAQEVDEPRAFTYAELDRAADRVAAWALERGEASYGVRLKNGVSFLAVVIGLAKAGRLAVLLGTRVPPATSAGLARACGVRTVIGDALPGLTHVDPHELLATPWPGRASRSVRAAVTLADPAVVIFTSGTTGNSKPALFSHRRLIGAGIAWGLRTGLTAQDRCYITLPLYHGNALAVAFSSVIHVGAAAVLRERFSVRNFMEDVRRHQCTAVVYIGELFRYLDSVPARPDDAETPLRVAFGNGLNRALWERTVRRFGLQRIVEHYGATEMPGAALTNWTGRSGYCGFIPADHPDAKDAMLVDDRGVPVPSAAPGELVLRIPDGQYRGYLDPAHDETRLCRGLREPNDLWWRSGDVLTRTDEGFFTFVERLGDTFRWRGENVAAADVEDAIYASGLVDEAVVFGVRLPGEEGRVGMASLLPRFSSAALLDLERMRLSLESTLAPYAIPIFVRQVSEPHGTTATLKIQKRLLSEEPFALIDEYRHWVLCDGCYVPLDRNLLERVMSGRYLVRPGLGLSNVAGTPIGHLGRAPSKSKRLTSLLGTRIHAQAGVQPDISDLEEWCRAALLSVDEVAIAVDAEMFSAVERRVAALSSRVRVVHVSPWGRFTPALNALNLEAARTGASELLLMSREIVPDVAAIAALRQWTRPDVLVVGARLSDEHGQMPGKQALQAYNSPWNTFALWNPRLLGFLGFPSISDGYAQSDAFGMEEVIVISLLQQLYPDEAGAYLVDVPGVVWRQISGDPRRDAAHFDKMKTKTRRANGQMERLKIPRGTVTVVSGAPLRTAAQSATMLFEASSASEFA